MGEQAEWSKSAKPRAYRGRYSLEEVFQDACVSKLLARGQQAYKYTNAHLVHEREEYIFGHRHHPPPDMTSPTATSLLVGLVVGRLATGAFGSLAGQVLQTPGGRVQGVPPLLARHSSLEMLPSPASPTGKTSPSGKAYPTQPQRPAPTAGVHRSRARPGTRPSWPTALAPAAR